MSAFLQLQRVLPQHALSRLIGRLASSGSTVLSRCLIEAFRRVYRVQLDEAARQSPRDYMSFNDFFTRELKPGVRRRGAPGELVSPADGQLSQFGTVRGGTLLQAKGKPYSCAELLGDAGLAALLDGGWFATVYLAPADYHRVHLPCAGTLKRTVEVPGELYSVNAATEAGINNLFCRNERLVCEFETASGPMALVLVGALIVASIQTAWDGPESPYRERRHRHYALAFPQGAEIGRFLLGSTVIVVAPPGAADPIPSLRPGQRVQVGEVLAHFTRSPR